MRTYIQPVVHGAESFYVNRVMQCRGCLRAIVEFGPEPVMAIKHRKGVPPIILALAQQDGVPIEQVACNRHGGEVYEPGLHLPTGEM